MILECPSCGTYYDTPAIIPPEGRKVRCAKCANTWLAMPEPPETTDSPDEPELSDSERDDADSSSQAIAEQQDVGEAVASDYSAADEALGEVAAEDQSDTQISVEDEEEPEPAIEDAPAASNELAEGEIPEEVVAEEQTDAQSSVEEAQDDASELEDDVPAQEADDELPPPPEADYPIGDFSHQGIGPARSPMQEVLTAAADSQPGDLAPNEGESQETAEDQQSQSAEPVAGEEAEVMAGAAEVEALDVSSAEVAEPAPASASEGEVPAAAVESEPGSAEPEPVADADDEIAAADQPGLAAAAAVGQDFQPSTRQLVSWAALALLVVIGFTLAMVNRETIVSALPGSASLYSGLGLAVNLRGLDFENVTSTWTMEADQPVLEVRGEIVNITDGQIQVPTVVFALHDEDGVEVHQWKAEVTEEPLEAGARTQFAARIPSPPTSSRSVQVKFATAP